MTFAGGSIRRVPRPKSTSTAPRKRRRRPRTLPPIVRCSRCGEVLIEAKPTRRPNVVCLRCLGLAE